jgi:hypothetical protein
MGSSTSGHDDPRRVKAFEQWIEEQEKIRKIPLKYEGRCVKCGREIPVGETAYWEKDRGVWHLDCGEAKTVANAQAVPQSEAAENCPRCGNELPPTGWYWYEGKHICQRCAEKIRREMLGPSEQEEKKRQKEGHVIQIPRRSRRTQLISTILVAIIAFSAGLALGPYATPYRSPQSQELVRVTVTTTLGTTVVNTIVTTASEPYLTTSTSVPSTSVASTSSGQPPKWISSSTNVVSYLQAANYIGQSKTVEGKIVRTYASTKGTVFLDFHDPYQGYFEVTIFASDVKNFPFSPVSFYLNKEVRVTGTIELYQGSPEIIVHSPSQIEVANMGFNYP